MVPDLPLPVVYSLLFFIGICTGGVIVGFTVAKELTPVDASATMTSLLNAAIMITTAFFQIVIGWLLDLNWAGEMASGVRVYDVDAYLAGFAAIPLTLIAALVLLAFVPETRCRQVAV